MDCDTRDFDFQKFKLHSVIGSGAFSSVYAACLKDTPSKFAIKKFAEGYKEEIILNEIRLMKLVDYHPNIIRFCGVTKFEDEKNYSLILEYANGGTLGKYLQDNAQTFKCKCESQLIFAHDIASAILCLHDNNIIHRDLHPDNILIHQGTIKLAGFGCSRLQGSNLYTKVSRGVIPYMDPKFLENHSYDLTKKSDIYSLGVLFWELTSCSSPFNFEKTGDTSIQFEILKGVREIPIPTTNGRFVKLYQKCWQPEPNERPEINQVISELNNINHFYSKESKLENCDTRKFDFQNFNVKKHFLIGSGAFASVYYAYWKGTQTKFAIKKFAEGSTKEIILNEIRCMKLVNYHPNIIGFCGVTRFEDEKNYSLVLEYANGGTLGKYLKDNAETFKCNWENQLTFAQEIASVISCLQDNKIIHRDLVGEIKLTDFGCSRLQGSDSYTKEPRGVIPYMDPKFLENHSYDLTEKSDIYSLGVLFWELTSCSSPFNFETTDDTSIQFEILKGVREIPIPTTNGRFVKLYQKCCQHEPNERPEINQVISELNSISHSEESVRIEELGNDECLRTEELKNEETKKSVVGCDLATYDKI
ncbi:19994_t:CDS:10 [Funneliformis geosporum]|nr:19994_t:CDS:10 [Funneliformis geosporum]